MKKTLRAILIIAVLVLCVLYSVSAGAASDDPADSYVKRTAEYEDSAISLWFDHPFRKTYTSDTVSTGMDTYSVYMAKNEIESAQFVLYSETDRTSMDVQLSEFSDGNGHTVEAEIYYEMYVTTENVDLNGVHGMTAQDTIIRQGEVPDPVIPYSSLKTPKKPASFKLNGGKSQAFLIRAKTDASSASGWYSAELSVYNSAGERVKVATVYLYVWDFVIPDEIEFQTSLFVGNDTSYGGSYNAFYDYLLENRMCAMDVPGGKLNASNPYLTNPRVNAIRVSSNGLGSVSGKTYMEATPSQFSSYKAIYDELSASPDWDSFKDKLYFYTADEFTCDEHQDDCFGGPQNHAGHTANTVVNNDAAVEKYWDDPTTMVTIHHNVPYPYYTYHSPIASIEDYRKTDNIQKVLDDGNLDIWCPQLYAFTPREELDATGYTLNGTGDGLIRNLNEVISGVYATTDSYAGHPSNWGYYDWDSLYGTFPDRVFSQKAMLEKEGRDVKMWTYRAGCHKLYTYCHHLIENTGLQTKMLFWQCYQEDITGYLYYATNGWTEQATKAYVDRTVTGAKTGCGWLDNKYTYAGSTDTIYGMGVLFYGPSMATVAGIPVVGTVRVECMRDGIEEYTMLDMLADYKGEDRSKEIVSQVSTNVVRYLSLNNFSTAAWDSDMDEYDIMAEVRKNLGCELEAAVKDGQCEHEWDGGVVTKAPGCLTVGDMTYTCTKCGAKRTQDIPAVHTSGETFTTVSGTAATCTSDGSCIMQCSACGYKKTVKTTAFHNDPSKYAYVYKNESSHTVKCSVCGAVLNSADPHSIFRFKEVPTCTENGSEGTGCKFCDYTVESTETPATGHNYDKGYCTVCGEKDPDYKTYTPGDLNSDGKINAADVTLLKKIIVGKMERVDAADVDGDTKVTSSDVVLLKKKVVGKA